MLGASRQTNDGHYSDSDVASRVGDLPSDTEEDEEEEIDEVEGDD